LNIKKALEVIFAFVGLALLVAVVLILFKLLVQNLFEIPLFIIALSSGALANALSVPYSESLSKKIRRAESEELKKEDDVLLQAVALSQSTFFIYLSIIPSSDLVTVFKIIVPTFAVLFYTIRALGKITDNGKCRFWSIWLFFLIVLMAPSYVVFGAAGALYGWFASSIYASILTGLMQIIDRVFRKRYGCI
jgi:hypothetical protein